MSAARPLGDADLKRLMARFGPFEPAPQVAVAVSGGADSMALAVLLKSWAAELGGEAVALVVDHGLRSDSAAEARRVGQWLGVRGLQHHLLSWRGPKPRSNRQAVARAARYRLLADWCCEHGILHLATAHHLDDQAETFLLRLGRGSGLDGLAAMAAVREMPGLRLLRPLLTVPKARLEATLRSRGVPWLEDPSNQDPAFARSRLRDLRPALAGQGLEPARLAETARHLGRARSALEGTAAALLAKCVTIDPAGFAWLQQGPLVTASRETGMRALGRVLLAVGGGTYSPRMVRLSRLYQHIGEKKFGGATLAGCHVLPRRGRLLVAREAVPAPVAIVRPGARLRWDGRFEVEITRQAGEALEKLRLGPLGEAGWREISRCPDLVEAEVVPAAARTALPALWDHCGVLAVPHLGFLRAGDGPAPFEKCRFAPNRALTDACFAVA